MSNEIEQHNSNSDHENNGNNDNNSNSNTKPELQAIADAVTEIAKALEHVAEEIKNGFQTQAAALIGIKPPPATPEKRSFDVA